MGRVALNEPDEGLAHPPQHGWKAASLVRTHLPLSARGPADERTPQRLLGSLCQRLETQRDEDARDASLPTFEGWYNPLQQVSGWLGAVLAVERVKMSAQVKP